MADISILYDPSLEMWVSASDIEGLSIGADSIENLFYHLYKTVSNLERSGHSLTCEQCKSHISLCECINWVFTSDNPH